MKDVNARESKTTDEELSDKKKDVEEIQILDKAQILEKAAREYFYSGEDELKKERYNSAVVLFFKALTSFVDLFLYENINETPSSHTERFRMTREKFQEVYDLIDKDFPFYQDSYVQILNKDLAEVIKNDAKIMAEKTKIKL